MGIYLLFVGGVIAIYGGYISEKVYQEQKPRLYFRNVLESIKTIQPNTPITLNHLSLSTKISIQDTEKALVLILKENPKLGSYSDSEEIFSLKDNTKSLIDELIIQNPE